MITVYKSLIIRDVKLIYSKIFEDVIDNSIIVVLHYFMYAQLMPLMGMSFNFVLPIFCGTLISVMMNISYDRALRDTIDLEFDKFFYYIATLPTTVNWLILRIITSNFITLGLTTSLMIVLGKILFSSSLDLSNVNFFEFLLSYLLVILYFSTFMVVLTFGVSYQWFRDNIWTRYLNPLAFLGCIYFPLLKAFEISKPIAYACLLSPVTYAVESFRMTILNTPSFLPLYICNLVLFGHIVLNIFLIRYFFVRRIWS
ncbi:hypothetical protein M1446_02585 [Candidatus Dependentiae bacterium]|nr:hypothetical protein [Candidatus Dependentiae bacterium]